MCCVFVASQVPFAKDIYGLILPNFGVGFAIGEHGVDSFSITAAAL